jgi:hypothetical protein
VPALTAPEIDNVVAAHRTLKSAVSAATTPLLRSAVPLLCGLASDETRQRSGCEPICHPKGARCHRPALPPTHAATQSFDACHLPHVCRRAPLVR